MIQLVQLVMLAIFSFRLRALDHVLLGNTPMKMQSVKVIAIFQEK